MGKRVFMSGTWDLFHMGHLRVLQRAKALGEFLVVGVCTDEYVQTYKDKPVIPFHQRLNIIKELRCVDVAVPQRSAEEVYHIEAFNVSVRAVGPEFGHQNEGQRRFLKWAKENGVEIVVMPRTPNISTTIIKERIKNG